MKTLFKDVTARLATVPALKWIDEDKGQMNFERPPVQYPAALITITLPRTRNLNTKRQVCEASIAVKLCFEFGGNTSGITPEAARDASLGYYDIVEACYVALQGYSTNSFNPLERVNFQQLPRPDAKKTVVMTFTTAFHDDGAEA